MRIESPLEEKVAGKVPQSVVTTQYRRFLPVAFVQRERQAWSTTASDPSFYLLLFVGLLLFVLAYQIRPSYDFQFGQLYYRESPFLENWNDLEVPKAQNADQSRYRWARHDSELILPFYGRQDLNVQFEFAGSANPDPNVQFIAEGQVIKSLHATPGWQTVNLFVPRSLFNNGSLDLHIVTTAFNPPHDPRELGVTVRRITITPGGNAQLTTPTSEGLIYLVLLVALAFYIPRRAGFGSRAGLLLGAITIIGFSGFIAFDRLGLTANLTNMVFAALWGVLLLSLADLIVTPVYRLAGISWGPHDRSWILTIFTFAFVAGMAQQMYPAATEFDLGFHINQYLQLYEGNRLNLDRFMGFTTSSEIHASRQIYPRTPYIFIYPLINLFNARSRLATGLVIQFYTTLLSSSSFFLIFYLARRFLRSNEAIIATLLYAILPINTLVFSWGITANVFGQWILLALLCLVTAGYTSLRRPLYGLLYMVVLGLSLLSHVGVLFISVGLFGLMGIIFLFRRKEIPLKIWPYFAGYSFLTGIIITLVVYQPYLGMTYDSIKGATSNTQATVTLPTATLPVLSVGTVVSNGTVVAVMPTIVPVETTPGVPAPTATFPILSNGTVVAVVPTPTPGRDSKGRGKATMAGGAVEDSTIGLHQVVVYNTGDLIIEGIRGFWHEGWAYFYLWPLAFFLPGMVIVWQRREHRIFFWTLVAWLVSGLVFALIGLVFNVYLRYSYFLAPAVAMMAAVILGAFWRRGQAGRLAVILILSFSLVATLALWYFRSVSFTHW